MSIAAGGSVSWDTINAGTTIDVTSPTSTITVGTATSGGSQTYTAPLGVTFGTLQATGIPGDPGNITVLSSAGPVSGGTEDAGGNVDLEGRTVRFTAITAGGDATVIAQRDVSPGTIVAGGTATIRAGTDGNGTTGNVNVSSISAKNVIVSGVGNLTLPLLVVTTNFSLSADVINTTIVQAPGTNVPLVGDVTGTNGGPGAVANLLIDSPNGLGFGVFAMTDATVTTTARSVVIANAIVPGTLQITTPLDTLFVNNRSSRPVATPDQQLFQPGFVFNLALDGTELTTNAYIVRYSTGTKARGYLDGNLVYGPSLVRDTSRVARNGELSGDMPSDLTLATDPLASASTDLNQTDGVNSQGPVSGPRNGAPAVRLPTDGAGAITQ